MDTGYTWSEEVLTSSYGVWGDPSFNVDTAGNFYFFHLSNPSFGNWIDRIVCQKSTDDGVTWSDGTFTGLNGLKEQDKEWSAIDRSNNNIYLTWTEFDNYGTLNPNDSTRILFSKSLDGGMNWSAPLRINKISGDCIDSDNSVEGAVPTVGPNGEIYVSGASQDGIIFDRSLDQGNTWLNNDILVDPMPGGWDQTISGFSRTNGLPVTNCDTSGGVNNGTIYINWADQRNGTTDTDIWLSKSTDGGNTWAVPVRVNDDTTNRQQFFTWMTIDQTNGYLYFVFYDRRNHNGDSTDVFVAVSMDGGTTFYNHKISQSPFYPTDDVFFGDYTNITVHNGIIRPIWTRLNNGQLSIWTDITHHQEILSNTENSWVDDLFEFENYPNPSSDVVNISFKLRTASQVSLTVYDMQGKEIHRVINNEKRNPGKYIERVELENLPVESGAYFLRLETPMQVKTQKMMVVK